MVAVLVAADLGLPPFSYYRTVPDDVARPPLAVDRVRMVGELVAVVVAQTATVAVDAAELVDVDIEPADACVLDARTRPKTALPLCSTGQRATWSCDTTAAASTTCSTWRPMSSEAHTPTNGWHRPRWSRARQLCVRPGTGSMSGPRARGFTPSARSWPGWWAWKPELVRVRSPAVGGGFGGRHSAPIEILVLGAVARHLSLAVTWEATRTENLLSMVHGRAQDHTVEMGFDDDGLIVGLRVHNLADCGAYAHFGPLMPFMSRKLLLWPLSESLGSIIPGPRWPPTPTRSAPTGARASPRPPTAWSARSRMRPDRWGWTHSSCAGETWSPRTRCPSPPRPASPTTVETTRPPSIRRPSSIEYDEVRGEQRARRSRGDMTAVGVGFASYVSVVDTTSETGLGRGGR